MSATATDAGGYQNISGLKQIRLMSSRAWNDGYPKVHKNFTITEKAPTSNSVLNVKALVGTFNQEKTLVGAFYVTEIFGTFG